MGDTPMNAPLDVQPEVVIPAGELHFTAVRSSGPGGQNVNKVASKVELRFDVASTRVLDDFAKARLITLAGSRIDSAGVIRIVVQDTRDQHKNLGIARERLAELVRQALVRPKRRKPTKPSRGAKERRLAEKKRRGETKRLRSSDD